jgi:hypothetical protein
VRRSGAFVTAPIASLPLLRIISRLSVDIEINFINAGLPPGMWLGMPCVHAQCDLAEFLDREASPCTTALGDQQLSTITTSSKLVAEDMPPA